MPKLRSAIGAQLRRLGRPAVRKGFQRFFKEPIKCHGVKSALVGKIASAYWPQVRALSKAQVFAVCEGLWRTGFCEEAFVACRWTPRLAAQFVPSDLAVFKRWIVRYVSNWATCDSFCNHTLGAFFEKYPQRAAELKNWARSPRRWLKRAAAVSLIVPARRGLFPDLVFELAAILLLDGDDMVQKGYGWLLKEASRKNREQVWDFVMRRRSTMPRTALRYAIELMPPDLRQAALSRP